MKIKEFKTFILLSAALSLILFTSACLDIMSYRSKIEVIPEGKGIKAAEFKMGTYRDFSEKPENVQINWNDTLKEYEIHVGDSKGGNFRLMHLGGKNYLLQAKEEDFYDFSIIGIDGDIVHFLDIKENVDEKVKVLMKTHGLEVIENDEITGTRAGLISFFTDLLTFDYLKPGEKIKYIGSM